MQSLRSTSVRRLCLSVTASVTRRPANPLFPALACLRQSFTSPSTRWYSSTGQFHHQVTEETGEETPSEVEGDTSEVKKPTGTLFLGNLPYSTTNDELREILSVYGPLSRVAVAMSQGRAMGYAHVDFESKQDAIKAFKDHSESPIMIEDRELRVDYAYPQSERGSSPQLRAVKDRRPPSSTIFIGGLPYEATEDDIRNALTSHGNVLAVRVGLNEEGEPKGFAHVEFASIAEAEKVLEHYTQNSFRILDRQVRMDRASRLEGPHRRTRRLDFAKWEENGTSLRAHFGALGSKIARFYFDKNYNTGYPTGSGTIEFRDFESANEALVRFNTPELALSPARREKHWRALPDRPASFGLRPKKGRD